MPNIRYNHQYSREELEEAVKQNVSIMGTMKTLKTPLTSGTLRKKITWFIKEYGIDTSHFLGMGWNKGLGINHKGGIEKRIVGPEDNRQCSKCGLIKLANEFYLRKRGLRVGVYYEKCKECMKNRGKAYYHQNQARQLALAKIRKEKYREERRKWLEKLKDKPCLDCGTKFPPYVMDFDHRDNRTKISSISWMAFHSTSNYAKIEAEIAKCDLVCANCHRIRTHGRIQPKAAVAKVVTAEV